GRASARTDAAWLLPIVRAWSISNAPLVRYERSTAAAGKRPAEIATGILPDAPATGGNSPHPRVPRILFVQYARDWNRFPLHQYTSSWNLPFFLRSPTKLTASSVERAPNWATISTSARSTSFAIRLASPQT